MYTPSASKSDAAALGLKLSTLEDTVDIWIDNFDVFLLFNAMSTQWRVGMTGATGLDYSVLPMIEQRLEIKSTKQNFDDLQIMEQEAMTTMLEAQDE